MRRSYNALANLLLIAVSLALVYGVFELFLQATNYNPPNKLEQLKAFIEQFQANPRINPAYSGPFLYALKQQSIDAPDALHVKSSNPRLVYQLRPGANYDNIIQINPQGFRDAPFSVDKPAGVFRICVAGDSNTFGMWVRIEDTYAKVLERLLNGAGVPGLRFEVYNMGVPGYNAVQEEELLRTEAVKYHPDMFLVGYTYNDDDIGADGGMWNHFMGTGFLAFDALYLRWTRLKYAIGTSNSMLQSSYSRIASCGTPALAVFFPPPPGHAGNNAAYHIDLGHAIATEIPILELYESFKHAGWDNAISDGVHPTELGHRLAAEAIFEWMKTNGPLAGRFPGSPPPAK